MMVPVIIFGCPGITAFAIAILPAIIGFGEIREGKTGGKVGYVGILHTKTPLNERLSLTNVCFILQEGTSLKLGATYVSLSLSWSLSPSVKH